MKLRKKVNPKVKYLRTEEVDINLLVPYPGNPRKSELKPIIESFQEHGQYKQIVVQESTKRVLTGNHSVAAAKKLGWDRVRVDFIDVDDERAKKIVLIDNKLSDNGRYDERLLADPEIGTGYPKEEIDSITSILDKHNKEILDGFDGSKYSNKNILKDSSPLPVSGDEVEDEETLEGADDRLVGTLQLSDSMDLKPSDRWGRWDIPTLLPNMLMVPSEWPRDISAWAGGATRDQPENDDVEHWWFYNFGISSTSGMNYKEKMVLSFYVPDDYFERWYWEPAKYVTRALNTGVKYAVTPNFSTWASEPLFESLHALYKSRWLGRYFQEAGIKVIPNVEWPFSEEQKHADFLDGYVLKSLPYGLPMLSMQANTAIGQGTKDEMEKRKEKLGEQIHHVIDTLCPDTLVFYGRDNWCDWSKNLGLKCNVITIDSFRSSLSKNYQGRSKVVL
jgi:hypothetical protein